MKFEAVPMALVLLAIGTASIAQDAPPNSAATAPANESADLAPEIVKLAFGSADGPQEAALASFEQSFRSSFVAGIGRNDAGKKLLAQYPGIVTVALDAGKAEFARQFKAVAFPQMLQDIAAIYRARMTPGELRQAYAYYRTPEAQQFLASFPKEGGNGAPVTVAQSNPMSTNPVVVQYRTSATGLKEQGLSAEIATAMIQSVQRSAVKVMPAVNQKIEAAMKTYLAKLQGRKQ